MADNGRKRLSSWKDIAGYLGRDLRTVARWEKRLGLPVHRVGGEKGRSVFAYSDEIDQWLEQNRPEQAVQYGTPGADGAPETFAFAQPRLWLTLGLAASILLVGIFGWTTTGSSSPIDHVRLNDGQIVAYDSGQNVLWATPFGINPQALLLTAPLITDLDGDGGSEVLVAWSGSGNGGAPESAVGTQVVALSNDGTIRWTIKPERTLRMGRSDYRRPWFAQSWAAFKTASGPRFALAYRHWTWWPTILAIFDGSGKVRSEFVNSGWIHAIAAIEHPERSLLLAGGISNSQDMGILAVLDPDHATGTSPEAAESGYECHSCAGGQPLQYIAFPRSELNRLTASPYNRVDAIQVLPDRVVVNTVETMGVLQTPQAINAIYEFSHDMELKSANFHHLYWDLHRRLEIAGEIDHSDEQCPERNGPLGIRRWTPETGWRDLRVPRGLPKNE